MTSALRLYPLGGLGEVGMNCLALEAGDDIVLIDCGVKFPDHAFGADVIHPDFSWLEARRDRFRAVVLTHGHEDHIGALPYLLSKMEVPVYGPPYALALVRERLTDHAAPKRPPAYSLTETFPGKRFTIGAFTFEPIRVTHSIADATALLVSTPAGDIIHTGDFKIDDQSPDGAVFDADRFSRAGDEGVRLLLSDSTNSFAPGTAGTETRVWDALAPLIAEAKNRVVVSIFASNIHRLRALFEIAKANKRKVCLMGRSVRRHVEAATRAGHLADMGHILVHADAIRRLPREEVLIVATGTQGEQRAALGRLAKDEHPQLVLEAGDTVVLSARVIPGNEQLVFKMVNDLVRKGVELRWPMNDRALHVSGHAYQSEQRRMIDLVRPQAFVPVHGTLIQLKRHAEIAAEAGVSDITVVENGMSLEVTEDAVRAGKPFRSGYVYVNQKRELSPELLHERTTIAGAGHAVIVLSMDKARRIVGDAEIVAAGVLDGPDGKALFEQAGDHVADEVDALAEHETDLEVLRERAQESLRRYLGKRLGWRPITDAVIIQVD